MSDEKIVIHVQQEVPVVEIDCTIKIPQESMIRGNDVSTVFLDEFDGDTPAIVDWKTEKEQFSFTESESLEDYDPEKLDKEAFKIRYAGLYQVDNGKRLSKASLRGIWRRFLTYERNNFFAAHKNLTIYDIGRIGIDKFIYTMGWFKKTDVSRWRNNKIRVGICAHCQDQFIPMMLQHNFGLCTNCKPLYSVRAVRNFMVKQMNISERYQHAHRDLLMDFFIMFYNDPQMRLLFLKDSEFAKECEASDFKVPSWYEQEAGLLPSIPPESLGDEDGIDEQPNN